ncbi:MAG TPA: hypothetical protein VFX98_10675 [Longimicrobiaceae bacterium]|nr:hypothetical protein [Longimicrobiaceae bacterium]
MQRWVELAASALFVSFIGCCVASGALQVLAWARHARPGASAGLRALWKPEGHFDAIGVRQMRLARVLLLLGGGAYASYGLLLLVAGVVARRG